MTLLAYRPDLGAALADDPSSTGLAEGTRDAVRMLQAQLVELTRPLTSVHSMPAAEKLVASILPDYVKLAIRWAEILSDVAPHETSENLGSAFAESIRESSLISGAVRGQLEGVLESSDAYFAWFARIRQTSLDPEGSVTSVVEGVRDSVARGELALNAIESVLVGTVDAAPEAIPILTELADRCWTEVEDYFLSLTEYGDDKGDTVPLSEVRADLGL